MAQKFVGYEVTKATAGYIRLLISKNNICTYTIYMVTGYEVTKVTAGYSRLLTAKNTCTYTIYMVTGCKVTAGYSRLLIAKNACTYTYIWLLVTRLQRLQQVTIGY